MVLLESQESSQDSLDDPDLSVSTISPTSSPPYFYEDFDFHENGSPPRSSIIGELYFYIVIIKKKKEN